MDTEIVARVALSLQHAPASPHVAAEVRSRGAAAAQALQPAAAVWRRRADAVIEACGATDIAILVPGRAGWPTQLDQLAAPPLLLYCRGRPPRRALLRSVAIVGSRAATSAGRRVARGWAATMAGWDFTIVSGGAYGIDAAAHAGALSAAGQSVAVLASGVDLPTPRGQAALLEQLTANGALLSEIPPGRRPTRNGFLVRNRLIAALAPVLVVVQAQQRSGALATARRAMDLHRVVAAVPGPVGEDAHAGCHRLIRDGAAVLVTSPAEVAELALPLGAALPDAS